MKTILLIVFMILTMNVAISRIALWTKISNSQTVSNTTDYSSAVRMDSVETASIQTVYTGSSLAGTFTPQVSNVLTAVGECSTTAADYVDITASAHNVSAGGSTHFFTFSDLGYLCLRLKYVSSNANTITINSYLAGKIQ